MPMWNPWRGCHKYSEGCKFCYIHKGDAKRGVDTNNIVRCEHFDAPIERYQRGQHKGEYKMKSGETVYLCFSSDFLLQDADEWRGECWKIIKERSDLHFLFLTKRIERFADCTPDDWVLSIRDECIRYGVKFEFRQTGSKLVKDGMLYEINKYQQFSQARRADINTE